MQCLDSLVDTLDTLKVMRDVVVDRELAGKVIVDQLRHIRSAVDRLCYLTVICCKTRANDNTCKRNMSRKTL